MSPLLWRQKAAATAQLLAILALLGCSGVQTPQTALKEAVEDYTRSMRWGHVERAATHIPDALRPAWVRQRRLAQAQVQVHEYDIRAVEYNAGDEKARVIVLAVWSRPADPVSHQQLLAQEWRLRTGIWWMTAQYELKAERASEQPVSPSDAL